MLFWFLFVLCYIPLRIFYPIKVIGKKNLPKKQGFVFTCNHYSNLDPVIIDACLKRKVRFLAKKELFKNKFGGWLMKQIGAFPVDREKPEISTFKFAIKTLKENKILGVFPEGTRNKTGNNELQEVKGGAIVFAGKGESLIVPAVLYKKTRFLRMNYLLIGEPLSIEAENIKRMTQEELEKNTLKLTEAMNKLREDFECKRKTKKGCNNAK